MDYYKFTKEDKEKYYKDITLQSQVKAREAKHNTTYFAVNSLGLRPLMWQKKFWDLMDTHRKVIACTPRQVGKSVACAVFALKATTMNTKPAGVAKKTIVGIISATEEQSKKLMGEIRRLISLGDKHVEWCTRGRQKSWYSNMIDVSKSASNNKSTITFKNGNQIICLPPTDRVRGYSFSYVFVDEAAFIEDSEIFFESIEPTVSQTGGNIFITSTPNGQQGWFFDLFDPFDELEKHEYKRLWVHYKDLNLNETIEKNLFDGIEAKKEAAYASGKDKMFEQEYEAKFTTQVSAFFDSYDVDEMFNTEILKKNEFAESCDMGVDFGMVKSHTVITISRINNDGVIERLYHYRYEFGEDDNLLEDVEGLLQRFNVQRIIPDDCPEGYSTIQKMLKKGWNVKPMSFKRDKVNKYFEFRSWLRQGKIKSYKDKLIEREMKALQEEETVRTTKIRKPYSGTDDLIDCFVMSSYFYLEPKKKTFKVYDITKIEEEGYNEA